MVNLQDVKTAIDQLSPEERAELCAYLEPRSVEPITLRAGTMDVDALLVAARIMRHGISDEEWHEIERSMNGA